ncbi:MAG: DNA replication/repair protein RecF [Acidimicrobiales bacterium]
MQVERLWLRDWRSWADLELELPPEGTLLIVGPNGQGKTNLLEGIAWLATLESFRGAGREAVVRSGAERAVLRAEVAREGRALLLEAEVSRAGHDRVLVNRQPLRRRADLASFLRVSVFAPDDLELVKGAPGARRLFLDQFLVSLHPDLVSLRLSFERVLRQRSALLRQSGGRLSGDLPETLDVWDHELVSLGEDLARGREELVEVLQPRVLRAYRQMVPRGAEPCLTYRRSWQGDLGTAVAANRLEDLRRATNGVGPHRDELELVLGGLPARIQASQGEQRSLALSLRLATHGAVTDMLGSAPVLLLDDVFSELDSERSESLLGQLPAGQVLLATAGAVPGAVVAFGMLRIEAGTLVSPGAARRSGIG